MAELGARIELQGGLIADHTQQLEALPLTFQGYDRDFTELYSRLRAVREDIFSQCYRLRSLEQEQERATVTFSAIWRPVLALEEVQDLSLQLEEERRVRLELTKLVTRLERRLDSRE
ncbi:hypothetical protein Tco_0612322 [Tanacetum coccineum]